MIVLSDLVMIAKAARVPINVATFKAKTSSRIAEISIGGPLDCN